MFIIRNLELNVNSLFRLFCFLFVLEENGRRAGGRREGGRESGREKERT
jgi:hypothetical protein